MKRLLLIIISFHLAAIVFAGEFRGRVVVEWLENHKQDRDMRLLEDFAYIDNKGKTWLVPKGTVVNGASIPPLFWNMIGPPFVGDYRRASVVHDYFCDSRTEPWQAVHKMFYEASLAGGVKEERAKIMYAAVYARGPRWDSNGKLEKSRTGKITDKLLEKLLKWAENKNPDIDKIIERINDITS